MLGRRPSDGRRGRCRGFGGGHFDGVDGNSERCNMSKAIVPESRQGLNLQNVLSRQTVGMC